MKNNSRKGVKSQRNKEALWKPDISMHPPQINRLELTHSATLRFLSASVSAGRTNVTFQNLLDLMLVATTATVGIDLFQAVRVRRVRMWRAISGTTPSFTPTSLSLEFAGDTTGIVGDQDIHTDTSMGVVPAHISARPSNNSLSSKWQVSSNNTAFYMFAPTGTVIDVELSYRSQFGPNVNAAAQNALVGATAGTQYLRGLDGVAAATTNFPPELLTAII